MARIVGRLPTNFKAHRYGSYMALILSREQSLAGSLPDDGLRVPTYYLG